MYRHIMNILYGLSPLILLLLAWLILEAYMRYTEAMLQHAISNIACKGDLYAMPIAKCGRKS